MLCSAFVRFVAAMEDSAMEDFIASFSASRLNGRRTVFPFLSFFFLSFELEKKDELDPDWLRP